jgi:hypothetical protein
MGKANLEKRFKGTINSPVSFQASGPCDSRQRDRLLGGGAPDKRHSRHNLWQQYGMTAGPRQSLVDAAAQM